MNKLLGSTKALGIFTLTNLFFAVYLNSSLNVLAAVVCFAAYIGISKDKQNKEE